MYVVIMVTFNKLLQTTLSQKCFHHLTVCNIVKT